MFNVYNRLWDVDLENVDKLDIVPDQYYMQRILMVKEGVFYSNMSDFYQMIVRTTFDGYADSDEIFCGHGITRFNTMSLMITHEGLGQTCGPCARSHRCSKCGNLMSYDWHHNNSCIKICEDCGSMPCMASTLDCACGNKCCSNLDAHTCKMCRKRECVYSDQSKFVDGLCKSCDKLS